ncbi:MAG: hypothetical protein U0M12_02415 [Acutalibacteraceae bacterium]|nr:hypothetical protein [Acutalibacteraceae bacterium]
MIENLAALKTKQDNIAKKIDRLACLKDEITTLKQEADIIEADLLKTVQEDLANTKYKSVKYEGTDSKLQATVSESVKITLESLLPQIFGTVYNDMVKVTTKSELTAPAKRLIAGIWQGNFVADTTVDEVISSMHLDNKTAKLVAKKCKGINYQKDIDNLITIANMTEPQAQEYAYLLMESAIWQQFKTICEVNKIDTQEAMDELMKKIQAAFIVEVTPKITIVEG